MTGGMMFKGTPGPWAVEFGTTLVWGPAPSHDTRDWGSSLAEVLHDTTRYGRTIDIHEAKANASLIAAAPELLEVCQMILKADYNCVTTTSQDAFRMPVISAAIAAIAKALGEQK